MDIQLNLKNAVEHRFISETLSHFWCVDSGLINVFFSVEFSLFSYNNGMVMSSCRELDNNRSALSAASAFAIATAGANEGTPTKEKYRRMSLASTGIHTYPLSKNSYIKALLALLCNWAAKICKLCFVFSSFGVLFAYHFILFPAGFPTDQRNGDKEFVIRRAATNRVLNVLRHWVSKHSPVNINLLQILFKTQA